jgi:plastocyanin
MVSRNTDESLTLTFDKPGTHHRTCSMHSRMIVTIVVE